MEKGVIEEEHDNRNFVNKLNIKFIVLHLWIVFRDFEKKSMC